MRMIKLAFLNFKNSCRSFLSLVLSLAFTIMIFLNFQNVVFSDALSVIGQQNKEYVDVIIEILSLVLGCFSFFFIWYATNVFLTKRKKEIGIYVFMGLSNQKIGQMYLIEISLIGVTALILGLGFGTLTTGLFQMIMLAISDIAVDIKFSVSPAPIVLTAVIYAVMYLIFSVKGYCNIVKSSVLDMISAARQNEYVRQNRFLLWCRTILGCGILFSGYYLANRKVNLAVLGNVFIAVVLVTIGVYLLFGGLIPLIFQGMAEQKKFLYRKERTLWINQMVFRMKKNYRTYAIVTMLVLSAVTALAAGFAMKNRYDAIAHFENTYTYQLVSSRDDLYEPVADVLEDTNGISYASTTRMLVLEESLDGYDRCVLVPYSDIQKLAADAGLAFPYEKLAADEVVTLNHVVLMTLILDKEDVRYTLCGKELRETDITTVPYLGYLQERMSFYMVDDATYAGLASSGQQQYAYNYCVSDLSRFEETKVALDAYTSTLGDANLGRIAVNPASGDKDWIRVMYSLCIFLFMVFIVASGCIMFMKLYNDAFEERPRYDILKKLGFAETALRRSVACELGTAYGLPFAVMAFSSCFSVNALGNLMATDLRSVNVISVLVVLAVFVLFYLLSITVYRKNVGI